MVAQIVVLSKVMYTHTNEHSLLHDNVLIYSIIQISQQDLIFIFIPYIKSTDDD